MPDVNGIGKIPGKWLENPSWAAYYHSASSERCREYIALEFRYSEYEEDEDAEEMDRIEEELDITDLRYLMKCCGNSPGRERFARRIVKKENSPKKEG